MAIHYLKRKTRTYRSLYVLNKSFDTISRHCWRLEQLGLMPIVQMRVFNGLVRELQAQMSHAVVSKMRSTEDRDMFRFGKTRIHWEHHLNPRRPDFSKLERM